VIKSTRLNQILIVFYQVKTIIEKAMKKTKSMKNQRG